MVHCLDGSRSCSQAAAAIVAAARAAAGGWRRSRVMQAVLVLALTLATLCSVYGRRATAPSALAPPGGLPPARTPLFMLLTHDDGVSKLSALQLRSVTDGRQTRNGCKVVATLFAKTGNTNCDALVDLHRHGYEIADHTVNHKRLSGERRAFIESEVVDARRQLAACGVPEGAIVGFRAPFLEVTPLLRRVLSDQGFLYDSSLVEDTLGSSASRGFANRLWPFDMGAGIRTNCSDWDGPYGTHRQSCKRHERWPGLWQVPIWRMGQAGGPFHMDPGFNYSCMCNAGKPSPYEVLKRHFDAAYAGNRAPMPVYVHPFWLRAGDNVKELRRFVDYALGKPDVYFVSMRQLVAWLQNPVPADRLTPKALGCGNPGGAGPKPRRARRRKRESSD
ncbi:polysaccharide deacetylase [Micractinium conductrix]|uniref:Polysaccharide deacetylase n=1 Tax=Micractinium conductrix TaxID=554055 RepID=A0A2P6VBL7_9CHLO|nr:polysaccharide deacetylase [Micractinium conductrix]|eukprot:PSC71479.1 polysaccharide deacetylase [Micractinium conductrix]